MVAAFVSVLLMVVLIGFVTIFVVVFGGLVLHIVAAVKASQGEYYRYPLNIRVIPSR